MTLTKVKSKKKTLIKKQTKEITPPQMIGDIVGYIYRTYDYKAFKYLNGNRQIRPAHLKKLIASFQDEQLVAPIMVNEKYEIIDGQHSYNSAQAVNGPVYYFVNEGYGVKQVQKLNCNMANWTNEEYMHSYCDSGIQDYIDYREFKIRFGFGHQESVALLTGSTSNLSKLFNDGNFKIKSMKAAVEIAEKIAEFKSYYAGYKRKSFMFAYMDILKNVKGFEHAEMIKKVAKQSTNLVDCTNKEAYVDLLETIYNYHRSKSTQLRFR